MGGKSSSSSKSDQITNTYYSDDRIVTESGIVAAGGSSIVANIQTLDGDIVKNALNYAYEANRENGKTFANLIDGNNKAFGNVIDFAADASDGNNQTLGKLIDFGSTLFKQGSDIIQTGQKTVLEGMLSAKNDERGAIDQKTIVVLGIAAAAALVFVKGNK